MIIDAFKHWESNKSQYGAAVRRAVEFIMGLNVNEMESKVAIEGDKMYVLKSEGTTQPWKERKGEYHAEHADIHIILEGEEGFGYAPASELHEELENFLVVKEKDYALCGYIENEQKFCLKPGMFTVFWPGEVHRPGCSDTSGGNFVKLVVKIHKSLFDIEGDLSQ